MAEKNYPSKIYCSVFFTPPRRADAAFVWRRPARDARSAHKTAHIGTTRPTPRNIRLRRCAFLTCAVVQPSTLRTQAALGSGFSLQAAFRYQNAMLALFLHGKKSLRYSPSPELSENKFQFFFCTRPEILPFCTLDFVVATIVAMAFLRRICSSRPGDGERRNKRSG